MIYDCIYRYLYYNVIMVGNWQVSFFQKVVSESLYARFYYVALQKCNDVFCYFTVIELKK